MFIKDQVISLLSQFLSFLFPQRKLLTNPKTIIVLKPCCLGDVVLATAAIAALKYRYPEATIDVAVGQWSKAVLENSPHIQHLIDSGQVGQGHYTWQDVWALACTLSKKQYDLAVTLDRSPIVGLIPWLAAIKHRLGLDSFGRGFAHTMRIPVPKSPYHEAQIYLDCVLATDTTITKAFWTNFSVTENDKNGLPNWAKTPFVVLHPAGGVNPGMNLLSKRWPVTHFAILADHLTQYGFQIVLSGTKNDIQLCEEVVTLTTKATPLIVAGNLSLAQFGALCQQAALFIGGDTGAMHIAVAVGCKVIAIFGPSDPKRYGPYAPKTQALTLWHEVALPSGGVGQGKITDFNWQKGVTVEEVWGGCKKMLALD